MNQKPKTIQLIVGVKDLLPREYYPNDEAILRRCREFAKHISVISTTDCRVVTAFCALHRDKEFNVEIELRKKNGTEFHKIELDIKGEFIQPWPDRFFETEFNLRFGKRSRDAV